MPRFTILFDEKEGSTALVDLLDNLREVSIVRADQDTEPFDRHRRRQMPLSQLESCLTGIFSKPAGDPHILNESYSKYADQPLCFDPRAPCIGFKMRFREPEDHVRQLGSLARFRFLSRRAEKLDRKVFREMMFRLYREYQVTIFISVRKDLLRWALSKYHGDGTGKSGHLQFRLAEGEISRNDIGKITVRPQRLAKIIARCQNAHLHKQTLLTTLVKNGITAMPLFYEDFVADQAGVLRQIFQQLSHPLCETSIQEALRKGTRFQKVHSDDISEFVTNHEEILGLFGNLPSIWS